MVSADTLDLTPSQHGRAHGPPITSPNRGEFLECAMSVLCDRRLRVLLPPTWPARRPEESTGPVCSGGARDCYWEPAGAWTGEIAPDLVHELGCAYVEVDHAECRHLFGQDAAVVARKAAATAPHTLKINDRGRSTQCTTREIESDQRQRLALSRCAER